MAMILFNYNFFLGLHIISMVSWMAGLFYVVRLFVYHSEVIEKKLSYGELQDKALTTQLALMERRLLTIIASPAMIVTIITGLYLAVESGAFAQSWFHWKLMLVMALVGYHFYSVGMMLQLRRGRSALSSTFTRLFNELAPVIFVAIVFLVSYKQPLTALGAIIVVVGAILFIYALYLFKHVLRAKASKH